MADDEDIVLWSELVGAFDKVSQLSGKLFICN